VTVHSRSLRHSYDTKLTQVFLYNSIQAPPNRSFDEIRFNFEKSLGARWSRIFRLQTLQRKPAISIWGTIAEIYYYISVPTHRKRIDLGLGNGLSGGFEVTNSGVIVFLANGARNKAALFIRDGDTWRREFLTGTHVENIYGIKLGNDNKTLLYNYSTASTPPQWYRAVLDGAHIQSPVQVTDITLDSRKSRSPGLNYIRWKGALDEELKESSIILVITFME